LSAIDITAMSAEKQQIAREQRNHCLGVAISSFGDKGAPSTVEVVMRADYFIAYIVNDKKPPAGA